MSRLLPLVSLAVLGLFAAPLSQAGVQVSTYAPVPTPEFALETAVSSRMFQDDAGNLYGIGTAENLPAVYKVAASGGITLLHVFPAGTAQPLSQDADGSLFGAVTNTDGSGIVYRITTGGDYSLLATIPAGSQVCLPLGTLLHASDGNYYGCTQGNQALNTSNPAPVKIPPCVYRVNAAGEAGVVAQFDATYGSGPACGLVEGADGAFYAATNKASYYDSPDLKIFRVTKAGELSTVTSLNVPNAYLAQGGPLVVAADGSLYGALMAGGKTSNYGGFFHGRIDGSGWGYSDVTGGNTPSALTMGPDGQIYAALASATTSENGAVVSIAPDLSQTQVAALGNSSQRYPRVVSVDRVNGGFNGVTSDGGLWNKGGIFHLSSGGDFSAVEDFHGTPIQSLPGKLSFAADGTAYGTRQNGTANGLGEVFRIAPDGTYSSVGTLPDSSPVQVLVAADGNLYGMSNSRYQGGHSTFFRMTTGGQVAVLKVFEDSIPKFFIQLPSGDFWGYTEGYYGNSEFFKIDATGTYTTMRAVDSFYEGRPLGFAYRKRDGYIYGTTAMGNNTWASIFRLSLTGAKTTMYSFTTYGTFPRLIVGSDGGIYGTTQSGGVVNSQAGYLYRYTPEAGGMTILHEMAAGEGYGPYDLTEATDGRLYVTTAGGDYGKGTIFYCTKAGAAFRSLHHFDIHSAYPQSLVAGTGGNVYGIVDDENISSVHPGWVNERVIRLQVNGPPTPFENWLVEKGLTGGANGDDDGDGISNIVEYATGSDPLVTDSSPARLASGVITPGTLEFSKDHNGTLTYTRRKDLPQGDVRLALECSMDLIHWINYPFGAVDPLASDDRVELIRADSVYYILYPYFRLRVTTP